MMTGTLLSLFLLLGSGHGFHLPVSPSKEAVTFIKLSMNQGGRPFHSREMPNGNWPPQQRGDSFRPQGVPPQGMPPSGRRRGGGGGGQGGEFPPQGPPPPYPPPRSVGGGHSNMGPGGIGPGMRPGGPGMPMPPPPPQPQPPRRPIQQQGQPQTQRYNNYNPQRGAASNIPPGQGFNNGQGMAEHPNRPSPMQETNDMSMNINSNNNNNNYNSMYRTGPPPPRQQQGQQNEPPPDVRQQQQQQQLQLQRPQQKGVGIGLKMRPQPPPIMERQQRRGMSSPTQQRTPQQTPHPPPQGGGPMMTPQQQRQRQPYESELMSPLPPPQPIVSKHVLYDMPVSNNGARCRLILYKKDVPPSEVNILSPDTLGGLHSPDFYRVNPQGLMPALVVQLFEANKKFGLSESDTIARYFMSKYAGVGPSFQPYNPLSNQMARFHDMYLTTIQGCLYKPNPPFGKFGTRREALYEFQKQLEILNDLVIDDGLYLCGPEISYADATIFPTLVFAKYMMPKFIDPEHMPGFSGTLPPKLDQYFETILQWDDAFARIHSEIMTVLVESWENERKRWNGIWLAGKRDRAPPSIFDRIVTGEMDAEIVRETDDLLAFKDIKPAAPAHVIIIPKDRQGLTRLQKATPEHTELLGKLLLMAGDISKDEFLGFGPDGARIVIDDGPAAGQEIDHLHVHVLGGRNMTWPPG